MSDAIEVAADIFRVKVEHITKAPKYCGDGIDGSCAGGNCEIVAAVEKIKAYANQQTAELRAEMLEVLQRAAMWLGKMIADEAHMNSVLPKDCERTLDMVETAIRKATEG